MDLDAAVVGYAADLRFEDLPEATPARTRLLILDTVGAALAAVGADGVTALDGLVRRWGGSPEAGVLGYGNRDIVRLSAASGTGLFATNR